MNVKVTKNFILIDGQEIFYEVKIRKAKNAKNIKMEFRGDNVSIISNRKLSLEQVKAIAESHSQTILNLREKAIKIEEKTRVETMEEGSNVYILGKKYIILIDDTMENFYKIEGDYLILNSYQNINETVKLVFKAISSEYFIEVLHQFAKMLHLSYNKVSFRDNKRSWGSCSSKRNLSFNYKLIQAEQQYIEYVVLHELCHLVHMNHSKDFWELVESNMPDYKARRAHLKKEGYRYLKI